MCPICWINGIMLLLFGASSAALGIQWYYLLPAGLLMLFGAYKMYDGWKRGKSMTDDAKAQNRKTVMRFVQGVLVGALVSGVLFYTLNAKEHESMHELLEQHGIEHHDH